MTLPAKITPDAIREALVELRFDHEELPDVIIGKLASGPNWKTAEKTTLPTAEIPEQVRALDPNLRYFPSLELRTGEAEVVRIGRNVLSHHNVGDYFGWLRLQPRLERTVQSLFDLVQGVTVTRVGLRYINALTEKDHSLCSIYDLNLVVEVKKVRPSSELQLVYLLADDPSYRGLVRVLSPEFLAGAVPPGTVAVIDVDIFTEAPLSSAAGVVDWLEKAHRAEKSAFFSLLTEETIANLEEA
jgi:uncharacterized protein (TIGR04255 family)